MKETRVGYVTTSILEGMLKDYLENQVDNKGHFIGKKEYIAKYQMLYEYNHRKEV